MAQHGQKFHFMDYILFVAMLIASLGIGLYSALKGKKSNTTTGYLMGDRNFKLLPVTLSLTVSIVSSNTLLGTPTEAYVYGAQYIYIGIAAIVAGILISLTFVPLIYPIKLISIHQYLEIRFKSKSVQLFGTFMLLIMQVLYVGTVIFGPATALEIATGMPTWGSLLMVTIIGTFYTAIGGMKAVVWTDAFQSLIMVGGMIAVIIAGTVHVGGPSKVWEINDVWGRTHVNLSVDPTERVTIWSLTVGGVFFFFAIYAANQPCMQRTCAMSTLSGARWSMVLTGPMFATFTSLAVIAGMVTFAYYTQKECDPVKANYLSNPNQVVPYFVMEVLGYPGIPGIYFACLFSGSLSSLSSSINSMTAIVWEDILKSIFVNLLEERKTLYAKVLSVFFGLLSLAVSFLLLYIGGTLIQIALSIIGATLGPVLGVFILAGLVPWANWIGALSGGLASVTVTMWLLLGQTLHATQTQILPTTIENCEFYETNGNVSLYNYTYYDDYSTTPILNGLGIDSTSTNATTHDGGGVNSALDWMYSIAFMWYSLIGVLVVLLVGIPISFATGATNPKDVHPALLFPCLRTAKMYIDYDYGDVHEYEINIHKMTPNIDNNPQVYGKVKTGI